MSTAWRTRQGFWGILIILVLGTGLAWAGSQGSGEAFGFPVFMICAVVAFGLNWLIFIHAWLRQTEHYFDLSGSTTYILLMVLAVSLSPEVGVRGWLLAAMEAMADLIRSNLILPNSFSPGRCRGCGSC